MNNEVLEALNIIEKEKNISKETLIEAIETSLITACKNHFGKSDNIRVDMDHETCEYHVFQAKTVVETVEDPVMEISLVNAKMINSKYELGDIVNIEIKSKEFGRIATQNAKNVILQKIREEERKILCDEYYSKEKDIVTGIVQRYAGRNVSINLGKVDAILMDNEQVKGEVFQPTERIKLYILEVKSTSKGPKILVSRTHPELVKRLFESEVAEVKSGIVEIKSIAREAGSRTKIAVWSNDPDVDAVGACVGQNGARVNAVVKELRGEKIDIITWNDNPAMLIENALSPAKVISVIADAEEKSAKVVVPDYQLSLAIGKEGQNARLAARLIGFKIDIKSETQAREAGDFFDYENDYEDVDEYEEYADESSGYEQDGYEDAGEYEHDSYEESERDGYEDGRGQGSYEEHDIDEPNRYADHDEYGQQRFEENSYDDSEDAEGSYDDSEDAEGSYDDSENTEHSYAGSEYTDSFYENDGYAESGSYENDEYPQLDQTIEKGEYAESESSYDDSYEDDGYSGAEDIYKDDAYTETGSIYKRDGAAELDESYEENKNADSKNSYEEDKYPNAEKSSSEDEYPDADKSYEEPIVDLYEESGYEDLGEGKEGAGAE